jgi:hypothetical protein
MLTGGYYGTALSCLYNSNPIITNTTFAHNTCSISYGSVIYAQFNSSPALRNSIVHSNFGNGIANDINSGCAMTMQNSLIDIQPIPATDLGGNIYFPTRLFFDTADIDGADNLIGTVDDGLRNLPCSPSIDAGDNSLLPSIFTTDYAGLDRVNNSTIDMGVYEYNDTAYFHTIANSAQNVVSNWQCTDGSGWTHFYNTQHGKLLLSLNYGGQPISNIQAQIITNTNYGTGTSVDLSTALYNTDSIRFASNRKWNVTFSGEILNPVGVRYYFADADYTDLQASNPFLQSMDSIVAVKIDDTSDAYSLLADSTQFHESKVGALASTNTFTLHNYYSDYYVEYLVNGFSGGYIGTTQPKIFGPLGINDIQLFANKNEGNANLNWKVTNK